jgi:molecular chaperone DnaJ
VQDHPLFSRQEDDLVYELPLNVSTAALGGKIEVPTLKGSTTLKIPSGTQHGQQFRFKGLGVPHLQHHGTGDLLVRVRVTIPTKLTPRQRTLLQELAQTLPESANGQHPGRPADEPESIVDKVKNLFD